MTAAAPARSAPVQTTVATPRFPMLDGVRAGATLAIVALHTAVYTNYFHGWEGADARQLAAGVTVFFLLTGFLLYRPFVAARVAGRPAMRLRDYTRRRLLRIVPAYWLALTVLTLWPGLPGDASGGHWWLYYAFLQDFDRHTLFGGLGTAWSLGTEVSFYLVLPIYALAARRLTRRLGAGAMVATELALLAGLSVLTFGMRSLLWSRQPNLCYTLLGTGDWFALGMALALLSVTSDRSPAVRRVVSVIRGRPTLWWVLAAVFVMLGGWYWRHTGSYDAYSAGPLHLIWGAIALCVLLPAVLGPTDRGPAARVLSWRLVGWLGIVSYGIYLWHLPLVAELGHTVSSVTGQRPAGLAFTVCLLLVVGSAAVACASLSYYFVERPLLCFRDGRRARVPRSAPATATHRQID